MLIEKGGEGMKKFARMFKRWKYLMTHRIKVRCYTCWKLNRLNETMILKSKVEYDGPFCTGCENKLIFEKKTDRRQAKSVKNKNI